jgi:hypothetical protein
MIQPDIKEAFDKWDIKGLAIVCDDHFVFLNVFDKIFQVLSMDTVSVLIKPHHRTLASLNTTLE